MKCNNIVSDLYVIAGKVPAGMKKMSLIKNDKEQRVMVFIDVRNIMNGARAETGGNYKIDFSEMTNLLVRNRSLLAAYIFDNQRVTEDGSYDKFHACLKYEGFRVIVRPPCDQDSKVQKEVDVAMACEILSHAYKDNYDVAIIVSGDRDFVPVMEHVQSLGKIVEVASFNSCISSYSRMAADKFCSLSKMGIMCLEGYRGRDIDEVSIGSISDVEVEVE